ncbi:MAG TPA: gluconate 2-dehydrogenase subunit 3 family protein [Gemmatimonadaceae bacterium]
MSDSFSRREFVAAATSLGAVWLLADVTERGNAMAHAAHQLTQAQPTLSVLTREQAAELEAFASRIIPSDDTPGAREAGVVYFIDRGLATWAKDQVPAFTDGLNKLSRDVAAKFRGQTRLSALTPAQQDDVLRSIERTPFFGLMRFATISGMFSLPSYGGNRDYAGWKLVDQEPAMEFRAPFGWYDQPANRRALLGGDA